MKINKIKIYNISSFAGLCEFDFTVSEGKNIILVGGQNGTGKTSLFTAIKLALYGPLSFSFQSKNNQYSAKIKELINHDAFAQPDVKAYIELDLDLSNEREKIQYTIKREWSFDNKKVEEKESFFENGILLNQDKSDFFQNYLFTILPPNLFDFFFFDGEQIATFFASANYNTYIKNAVLTLCSYDTFNMIKKYCDNFVNSKEESEEHRKISAEYERACQVLEETQQSIVEMERLVTDINEKRIDIKNKRDALEQKFKLSGGLSNNQKSIFNTELKKQEKIKEQCATAIKNFVEEQMPFVITMPIADDLKRQLSLELQMKQYQAVVEKISPNILESSISGVLSQFQIEDRKQFINQLSSALLQSVKPEVDVEAFAFTHDLSQEQKDAIYSVFDYLEKFKRSEIISKVREKESATDTSIKINKLLRESMPELDANTFLNQLTALTEEDYRLQTQVDSTQINLETSKSSIESLEKKKESLLDELKSIARNKNAYVLTQNISKMMNYMITDMINSKFKEIESNILRMVKKIMRKDRFIDLVELDNDFNIYLYKKQIYTYKELSQLITNIGNDELSERLGKKGIELLLEEFNIDSILKLKNILRNEYSQRNLFEDDTVELYKKIEFNQLSKGEKQVFILSLYWAIIKASNKDIPFIIDTPYARIDTEHREQISKKFFPSISNQVIIFSTDEEITPHYHSVLHPYIAKEYLLQYNELESKTEVQDGYFFKEIAQ